MHVIDRGSRRTTSPMWRHRNYHLLLAIRGIWDIMTKLTQYLNWKQVISGSSSCTSNTILLLLQCSLLQFQGKVGHVEVGTYYIGWIKLTTQNNSWILILYYPKGQVRMLKWTCCVAHSNKWRYLRDLFKNGQKFKRISLFDENYIDVATNHQVLFFFFFLKAQIKVMKLIFQTFTCYMWCKWCQSCK